MANMATRQSITTITMMTLSIMTQLLGIISVVMPNVILSSVIIPKVILLRKQNDKIRHFSGPVDAMFLHDDKTSQTDADIASNNDVSEASTKSSNGRTEVRTGVRCCKTFFFFLRNF
jgi:hypothetical protein